MLSLAKKLHKRHGTAWAAPAFDALGTKDEKFRRETAYDDSGPFRV